MFLSFHCFSISFDSIRCYLTSRDPFEQFTATFRKIIRNLSLNWSLSEYIGDVFREFLSQQQSIFFYCQLRLFQFWGAFLFNKIHSSIAFPLESREHLFHDTRIKEIPLCKSFHWRNACPQIWTILSFHSIPFKSC